MKTRILLFSSCFALLTSCSNSSDKLSDSDQFRESQVAAVTPDSVAAVAQAPAGGTAPASMDSAGMAGMPMGANATTVAGQPVAGAVAPSAAKLATLVLEINVVAEMMKFDIKTFTVKAGQKVIINVNNPDSQQHNLVIGKIGSLSKIGGAATAMISDPSAIDKGYVPNIPEVIVATGALNAEASDTIEFIAPSQPGDYPFLCTFPGHWMMMNGIMKVVP